MSGTSCQPMAAIGSAFGSQSRACALLTLSLFVLSLHAPATSKRDKPRPPVPDASRPSESCKTPATADTQQSMKTGGKEPLPEESATTEAVDSRAQTTPSDTDAINRDLQTGGEGAINLDLPPGEEQQTPGLSTECAKGPSEDDRAQCSTRKSKAGAAHCERSSAPSDDLKLPAQRKK